VLVGLLSLAAIPVALYSTRLKNVNLPQAVGGEAVVGTLLGLIAVLLARGARFKVERTLSRAGEGTARLGKWLGLLGICLGLTAALSLAFFEDRLKISSNHGAAARSFVITITRECYIMPSGTAMKAARYIPCSAFVIRIASNGRWREQPTWI